MPAAYRSLWLSAAGAAMLVGGVLYPPGLDGGSSFEAHTAAMLAHPNWFASHALTLAGSILLLVGLVAARGRPAFQRLGPRLIQVALFGVGLWFVESVFHLLASREGAERQVEVGAGAR